MELVVTDAERLLGIGIEDYSGEDVEKLEAFIIDCNEAASEDFDGEPLVEDAVYDRLIDILSGVKPESGLLRELWDDTGESFEGDVEDSEDVDVFLKVHPMASIETVKSWSSPVLDELVSSVEEFRDTNDGTSLFFAYKINGHGIRVVYKDGKLVKATSRARSSKGRDITRQLRNILGDTMGEMPSGIVEIRGEICLKLDKLEEARKFNPEIKSAFSGVSSLIKPSSTAEENKLLDFLAYRYYDQTGIEFTFREEEYQELERLGFSTPDYSVCEIGSDEDVLDSVKAIFTDLETEYEDFGYFCDGIVLEVNDKSEFASLGSNGPRMKGNVALKVGDTWAQDKYTGFVEEIIWTPGKSKMSPVAIVVEDLDAEDGTVGVLTVQGNRVRRVPLYEPKNILILGAYPGKALSFKYGGEAGVVPCYPDGRLLTDDYIAEMISEG